jgi:hypothetical protein
LSKYCRDAGNDKKAREATAHQRAPLYSIDRSGEDISLQVCVDSSLANESLIGHVPLTIAVLCFSNKVYSRNYNCANAVNQVTFKITPHEFAQKASLEIRFSR